MGLKGNIDRGQGKDSQSGATWNTWLESKEGAVKGCYIEHRLENSQTRERGTTCANSAEH